MCWDNPYCDCGSNSGNPNYKSKDDLTVSKGSITYAIYEELKRQKKLWGTQTHKQIVWLAILAEEFGEVSKEVNELHFRKGDRAKLRTELVQTAAVCVSMIQSLDRNDDRLTVEIPTEKYKSLERYLQIKRRSPRS